MKTRTVVPRLLAQADIEVAIDHYRDAGGERLALDFVDAVQRTFEQIGRNPSAGSPRYATELALPGLRSRRLRRFPVLVFYVEAGDHVDVWRVLHGERDIPSWLHTPAEP